MWFSEPFKLWALFCLVFWLFSGPRLGGGVHRHHDVVLDDKSKMTGATGMFVLLLCMFCVFLSTDEGALPPQ